MKKVYKIALVTFLSISNLFAQNRDFKGYLFAYFEGKGVASQQEQLRFAVSEDAVNWRALNNNEPIIPSKDISSTGGIRDPHILRKADGNGFYIVATDMNTKKNGWDYNPGIVLMQSKNLLDWKSSVIDIEKLYPKKFKDIKWVWAPQTFNINNR